jgi:hypothetical protein
MDREEIRALEHQIADAVRAIVEEEFFDLPPEVFHFMAKAAVAVLEAAVEVSD